ncbi:reverse transcriptase domain-containing protein [Tanacetum coccineum]
MQAARDRQKSYADLKRKPMDFQVRDRVMLKVLPWKGVVLFGKRGKLNPRYVEPFKVLEKKYYSDEPLAVPLEGLHVDDKLHFVEEPVKIMDREVKQLKQNHIPIVKVNEARAGMPNYGKFLKELISNKNKTKQIYAAFLSEESLAMIQNKVPPKLRDPGSFLIPCNFNKTFSCNALADLGANINLMPYSLYAKLSLETLKPNKMSVRLADRSFQYLVGIAENILVKVGKFTFPADFVILEMEEDSKVPLILGRPFLHTADAVIKVK